MNPDISETAFLIIRPIRRDALFKCSGVHFKNNVVLVSGFTGFKWREGRFV